MRKYTAIVLFFFLCFSLLFSGIDKKQKTYELIYKDIQELKKQFLELNKKTNFNSDSIRDIQLQIGETLKICRLLQKEQRSIKENRKSDSTEIQAVLQRLNNITNLLSGISEELIEIKNKTNRPFLTPDGEDIQDQENASSIEDEEGAIADDDNMETDKSKTIINPDFSPKEIYNMARSDYLKGNYSLSIDGFKLYLEQFPESPRADNAIYWIGECYFSQRRFELAIEHFKKLVVEYPQGDKVPAAYLKRGISLREMGREKEASSVFRILVGKFPMAEEARIAQEKIKEIKQS